MRRTKSQKPWKTLQLPAPKYDPLFLMQKWGPWFMSRVFYFTKNFKNPEKNWKLWSFIAERCAEIKHKWFKCCQKFYYSKQTFKMQQSNILNSITSRQKMSRILANMEVKSLTNWQYWFTSWHFISVTKSQLDMSTIILITPLNKLQCHGRITT